MLLQYILHWVEEEEVPIGNLKVPVGLAAVEPLTLEGLAVQVLLAKETLVETLVARMLVEVEVAPVQQAVMGQMLDLEVMVATD
jgi:hypothetical protein